VDIGDYKHLWRVDTTELQRLMQLRRCTPRLKVLLFNVAGKCATACTKQQYHFAQTRADIDIDELRQEIWWHLLKAYKHYKPERGLTAFSFAYTCGLRKGQQMLRNSALRHTRQTNISVDAEISDTTSVIDQQDALAHLRQAWPELVAILERKPSLVMRNGKLNKSQTARALKMTWERFKKRLDNLRESKWQTYITA
jgi:DNA-directed RNA polymerase specialized sigma24 family protein